MDYTKMGYRLQKAEAHGAPSSSWSTVDVDVVAFACSSGVARTPASSCPCSLAHVSTVLVFFLIDKSGGPLCFSECIMAALMSFIEALE